LIRHESSAEITSNNLLEGDRVPDGLRRQKGKEGLCDVRILSSGTDRDFYDVSGKNFLHSPVCNTSVPDIIHDHFMGFVQNLVNNPVLPDSDPEQ
jgi:hypothetical protein